MTEQKESYKNFIEDLARIWLEYLIAYSENGLDMEEDLNIVHRYQIYPAR